MRSNNKSLISVVVLGAMLAATGVRVNRAEDKTAALNSNSKRVLRTSKAAPEAQKEGSQTCNVWESRHRFLRSEGAPQPSAASSTRGGLRELFQRFHLWLPSHRRFTAKHTFSTRSKIKKPAAISYRQSAITSNQSANDPSKTFAPSHRAPLLGTDLVWADGPHILIEAWQNKEMGDALYEILQSAGVRSLRLSFHGMYSHLGEEASAKIKAENKMTNEYPWFGFADFSNYIAARDFTTIVGINVEEGAEVAAETISKFVKDAGQAKLVAVELSNEPWLNHRPWQPEEYAARAADVIERLTPMGVKFALPLTVGDSRNTPTKLSDTEWNTRMMRALSARLDLKNREDIYGVLHLYADGVRAKSVEFFNRIVRPFAPKMRYLVTEFNIRLNLEGNPHLTNKYAMELARKLAELMNVPDIEAMYVHAVPYHSILYWSNRRGVSTVIGGRDKKLKPEETTKGWHLTPAGKVYALYSKLAWNGDVLFYKAEGKQRFWAVKSPNGAVVISLLNEKNQTVTKRINILGKDLNLTAPPQSVICVDENGRELGKVLLPF